MDQQTWDPLHLVASLEGVALLEGGQELAGPWGRGLLLVSQAEAVAGAGAGTAAGPLVGGPHLDPLVEVLLWWVHVACCLTKTTVSHA